MRDLLARFAAIAFLMVSGLMAMAQTDFDTANNGEPVYDKARAQALPRAERLDYNKAYKAAWETWASSNRQKTAAPKNFDKPVRTTAPKRAPGTIQYDDGVASGPATAPTSQMHGNQFDSGNLNPVMSNGSVTQVDFYMVSVGGTGAFVTIMDQVNGTTANLLISTQATGLNSGTFNNFVFTTPINYAGNTFLAGVWLNAAPPGADALGLGSGTVGGQGHHGVVINDVTPTAFTTVPSVNYLIRPTGNIITPVELINFEIE